jgi:hypothetical protein
MKMMGVQDQAFKDFRYAKIQGRIATWYGWVAFRYYYNPVANDRRLVFDPKHNVLKPAAGAPSSDLGLYETNER